MAATFIRTPARRERSAKEAFLEGKNWFSWPGQIWGAAAEDWDAARNSGSSQSRESPQTRI